MLYDQIQEAIQYIQAQTNFQPKYGIILGTGLSDLIDDIEIECEIPYHQIPHFPVSTVASHKGKLVFGTLDNIPVIAMAGRFHYYEGYTMKQVTFPVRVMKFLGIQHLLISNAAGSINADIHQGHLVFIKDHINLQPENPLRGENDERLGVRFPDMLKTYDRTLNAKALEIAKANGISAHEGVYVGLQGPNLETPAEYVYMHRIGGDVVGMSTVPEVLVARHSDLPVFVVSVVSNQSYPPEVIKETTLEEVVAVVQAVTPKVCLVVRELLKTLALRV
ncbi:MAG: purine-nucleoside phosphorylase [Saprospiraceae bacterium]|jgi:purine-nucleoside phosphorylase